MMTVPSCTPLSLSTMNPGLLRGFPRRRRRSILRWLADAVRELAPALARR